MYVRKRKDGLSTVHYEKDGLSIIHYLYIHVIDTLSMTATAD